VKQQKLTVDSNGEDLVQDEAVGANEAGNLSKTVNLGVVVLNEVALVGVGLNKLNIEVVHLGDDHETVGTGVTRESIELSERHDCDLWVVWDDLVFLVVVVCKGRKFELNAEHYSGSQT